MQEFLFRDQLSGGGRFRCFVRLYTEFQSGQFVSLSELVKAAA
jgi:hypothetical protein